MEIRMSDITSLSVRELVTRIAKHELSAERVAQAYIEKVESLDSRVRAWQYFDASHALQQARKIDLSTSLGPLSGVPIGVKDVIDTADMPSTYGSPIYSDHRPVMDAAVVAAARTAGAIVFGKTVTTEFATYKPGPTVNPHSLRLKQPRTPGGSSSGSAAAVAAGMVPLAFATQTAASVVRPAAYCGIVGYKPTFNTLPTAGVKLLSPTLDTVGVLARSVDDARLFVSGITRRNFPIDTGKRSLRIGLCKTPHWGAAEEASRHALLQAGRLLERQGATIKDANLPKGFERLADAQLGIMSYEAFQALAPEVATHGGEISEPLQSVLEIGESLGGDRYVSLLQEAEEGKHILSFVFDLFDVLIAPSAVGEAPAGLHHTGDPVFGRMWTLLGNPCVHVPTGTGPNGLPVGVTVIGPRWKDSVTLSAAALLETAVASNQG
jgi:Asp-tRNA(Asn)/Glu-tRNA(Gln) amidotransferase A subunit family amidase